MLKISNLVLSAFFTEDFHYVKDVERVKDAIRSLGIENKLVYKLDKDVGKYAKSGYQKP